MKDKLHFLNVHALQRDWNHNPGVSLSPAMGGGGCPEWTFRHQRTIITIIYEEQFSSGDLLPGSGEKLWILTIIWGNSVGLHQSVACATSHLLFVLFFSTRLKRVRRLVLYDISGANTLFSLSASVCVCVCYTYCMQTVCTVAHK